MTDQSDLRRGRHCVFAKHVHLVCVTRYRRRVFTKAVLDDACSMFTPVCADFGAERVEMDDVEDHAHPVVNARPSMRSQHWYGASGAHQGAAGARTIRRW